jgi:hypothetical protein
MPNREAIISNKIALDLLPQMNTDARRSVFIRAHLWPVTLSGAATLRAGDAIHLAAVAFGLTGKSV